MPPSESIYLPVLKQNIADRSTLTQAQTSPPPEVSSSVANQDAAMVMIPICFVAVWAAVVCVISNTWKVNRKDVETSKLTAQSPCKKCRFFNSNPYVKCAVNPSLAMTTAAKDCTDYQPKERKLIR
ncbi:hypothetical protein ACKFKF_01125 [Phormidesmis sp. 146-12]